LPAAAIHTLGPPQRAREPPKHTLVATRLPSATHPAGNV